MDHILRFLTRQFAYDPSPCNAMSLANAVLRSQGVSPVDHIPTKLHGYLTYAGLLQQLLQIPEDHLSDTVTVMDSEGGESRSVTNFNAIPSNSNHIAAWLDHDPHIDITPGNPVLMFHHCLRCAAPLSDDQARRYLETPETVSHRLCPGCTLCGICANPEHEICPGVAACLCCSTPDD